MRDEDKTREQLMAELAALREDLRVLEKSALPPSPSEEAFKELFEGNPHPMWIYDLETLSFLAVNNAAVHRYGYSREEFLSMTIRDIRPPEDIPALLKNVSQVTDGLDEAGIWRHIRKDGTVLFVEITSHVIIFRGRRAELVLAHDLTERRKAELALAHRVEMERIISSISTRFLRSPIQDIDGTINGALEQIGRFADVDRSYVFLFTRDGTIMDNTHEWCAEGVEPQIDNLKNLPVEPFPWLIGKLRSFETIYIPRVADLPEEARPEREVLEAQDIRSLVLVPMTYGQDLIGYLGFDSVRTEKYWDDDDIGLLRTIGEIFVRALELQRAQESLHSSEQELAAEKERLLVTLRSIGDGVITTDTQGRVLLLNVVAEAMTGWTEQEALGRPLSDVFQIIHEKTRQRCANPVERVIERGGIVGLANQTVLISRKGTERIIADSGAPIRKSDGSVMGVVLVFRDITEKRRMEAELLKAQKLESVGILAGGIAHDFNNILTAILGNISLAKLYAGDDKSIFERLAEAEKAVARARDLTYQLLTFSKGGAPVRKPTTLLGIIQDTVGFALRGSRSKCNLRIPADLWHAEADEGQISQVINNLLINADQAMPEGGIINVSCDNMTAEDVEDLPLKRQRYVRITITDHGLGIPEDHLPRIFDPYFTTKQRGSGLGLATAYSIVRRHDGYMTVESELGKGSTFLVYLPAAEEKGTEPGRAGEPLLAGKGRVLVMDDELFIREIVLKMLHHLGYEAEAVPDGSEMINAYRKAIEAGRPFDVVIADLTVPGGMGGKEALAVLKQIDPAVRAIVSSGYSNDPVLSACENHGFCGFISKPYRIQELSTVIRETMAKKQTKAP